MAGKSDIVRGALEGLSDVLPEGMFSPVAKSVENIPQQKGEGDQMLGMISKGKGVKESEIKDLGLDNFLLGKPSVTKTEIEDFLSENQINIEESVRGGSIDAFPFTADDDGLYQFVSEASKEKFWFDKFNKWFDDKMASSQDFAKRYGDWHRLRQFENFALESERVMRGGRRSESEDAELSRVDYLSDFPVRVLGRFLDEAGGTIHHDRGTTTYQKPDVYYPHIQEDYGEILFKLPDTDRYGSWTYMHWPSETNVFAHARFSTLKTSDGKESQFLQEVQSDLHQQGLKEGYYDSAFAKGDEKGAPNAPFKKNWHELVFRRMLQRAINKGFDSVSWTPAKMQMLRYPEASERGMENFYDEKLVNYANKIGKKFGAKVYKDNPPGKNYKEHLEGGSYTPGVKVWVLPITDSMRKDISEKGIPVASAVETSNAGALSDLA